MVRMDPETFRRIGDLFTAAVDLDPDARAAFLARECRGDAVLRREVERLLAHDAPAGWEAVPAAALAEELWAEGTGAEPVAGETPTTVGEYRLVQEIGRGGTGVVYRAERTGDPTAEPVAIKLIRRGLDTDEVLRRFRIEPAALGRLDHPHIARIHEVGVAADGRPYLILELVDGEPIDDWCDRRRLPVRARLELFLRVAAAVAYAHRNLVAHRDLKPSNVLVTGTGEPKLLDFGLARFFDQVDGGRAAPTTALAHRRFTPEFASPEQVRGEPTSTASDVYSLGVVLYQLLSGRPPYRFTQITPLEVERVVCTVQPPRPSAVVGRPAAEEIARARATTPDRLRRQLSGDLDVITARALAKDPRQRYGSVEQLAEDLSRHLQGRPIAARPAGPWARTVGLLRRHRITAAFLALAGLFTAGVTIQSARLQRSLVTTSGALAAAQQERARAEAASEFLVELFEATDPRADGAGNPSALELIQRGADRVQGQLADQPALEAALLDALGRVHFNLGRYDEAAKLLREAFSIRRRLHRRGPHPDLAASLDRLGRVHRVTGDYRRAEVLTRAALAQRQELFGEDHEAVAESLNSLGLILGAAGRAGEAEAALARALEIRRRTLGETHVKTLDSLTNLGTAHFHRGDPAAAEPLFHQAVELYGRRFGPDHPSLGTALHNLALASYRNGNREEAIGLLRRALELHRRHLGADHPAVAGILKNLGGMLLDGGDAEAAEPLLREALELHRRRFGEAHPAVAGDLIDLGSLLQGRGQLAAAVELFRQSLEIRHGTLPPGHPDIATSLVGLGSALVDLGQPREAEPLLREGLEIRRRTLPAGHWRIAVVESVLGGCLSALGQSSSAEPLLRDSLSVLEGALGPGHRFTVRARERLDRWCAGATAAHGDGRCATSPNPAG
jgi:serine/threonine-protein kinase